MQPKKQIYNLTHHQIGINDQSWSFTLFVSVQVSFGILKSRKNATSYANYYWLLCERLQTAPAFIFINNVLGRIVTTGTNPLILQYSYEPFLQPYTNLCPC